jgi:hypothetical protein
MYLVGAVAVSTVACVLLWARNRRPRSTEHAIDSFRRELRALAPDHRDQERRHSG